MNEIKYKGIVDLSAKNNSHTIAYEYIAQFANSDLLHILEVGCSSGYFGHALKAGGHTVWGVEPDVDSAKIAEKNLDYVFIGSVDEFIAAYPDKKFDVITFGDVLEHMADPGMVLQQCLRLLVEGGAIVASVPNVAHIAMRAMLLEGVWEYAELGILDRSHLRFFTRSSIQDLFVDSGFAVMGIKAVTLQADITANISKIPCSQRALDCVESFASDDCKYDFQYVLLGVPIHAKQGRGLQLLTEKPTIKVLALAYNVTQSHFSVRLGEALKAWAALYGGELDCRSFQECDRQAIERADILVIQRHIDVTVMRIISVAQRLGKKIVFEIDDLLIHLPEFLSHHQAGLVGYEANLSAISKQVNCLTVTTNRLMQQLEYLSKPIIIIPNCVSAGQLPPVEQHNWKSGIATIIVGSSDKVLVDFILPAISRLVLRKDITVNLVVIGPPGENFDDAGIRCQRIPHLTYDEFKKFIRTIDNPISVIPLDDSLFSSCKSPVKYFDYSLAGIPVICSNVPPYADVVQHGVNGLLVADNATDSWVNAIEELVQSTQKRKALVSQALALVKAEYSIESAAAHWHRLFTKLDHGSFPCRLAEIPTEIQEKVNQTHFLLSHLVRPASYKAALRVLKRDGLKGLASRVFSRI
jgi:glycosyltransferase involved in cell wall biosynthesis/2-polyprenyl-3-methyl-5-hydroxy-6-metoxy-1,4-benzoquinol methylase